MAPLTRRRKRALAVDAAPRVIDHADRLSRLPEEILAQILSFLPAQEAVRTCVLARTWRDVWKFTRRLRILGDDSVEFVDRLLGLRLNGLNCSSLDECEIEFAMDNEGYTRKTINRWIHTSLNCQVQALRVHNIVGFGATILKMDMPLISRHLTRLEVHGVCIECININLDGCPALEHLEMKFCFFVDVRKIMSPSIKRLVIKGCDSGPQRYKISAPRLVSLWLEVGRPRTPLLLLDSMPELVEAHVTIDKYADDNCSCDDPMGCRHVMHPGYVMHPRYVSDGDAPAGCLLLEGLAQAKHLVLLADHSVYIFRRDLRFCPTFSNLKALVLNGNWCEPADCRPLACILEHAPVLEKLTVLFSEEVKLKYDIVLEGRPDATAKSTMTTQCLKTVKVKCYTVHEGVVKVLKFLSILNIWFQFGVTEGST